MKLNKLSSFLLCAAFTVCLTAFAAKKPPPPSLKPVNLGAAAPFAVFGVSGVTNVPSAFTVINGDLGSITPSVTGFFAEDLGNGIVNGTIDDNDVAGTETSAAVAAAASLGTAITDAQGRPCSSAQAIPCGLKRAELGGLTLTPGVYRYSGVATLTTALNLSGSGVYIFQLNALTVNPGGTVTLASGATAANVFWVTTQATLNSTAAFAGNILSTTGVTFTAGAGGTVLTGRALAQTQVTFAAGDTVTLPQ